VIVQSLVSLIAVHDENYAFAHRDNLTIHLASKRRADHLGPGAYIDVDDADRLA
jgi:hypothetical protein